MEKTLDRLDANKSCGSDSMEAKFLKIGAQVIAPSLTAIFNASLKTGIFPDDWKTAVVTPVFKKGDRSEASNYRPISLLPCVSKVLEELVFKQLSLHLESHNLLPDCQYGLRKQRSTEDATMLLADNILTVKDSGLCSGAVFLDLIKAFDTVHHCRMLKKLEAAGVEQKSLSVFRSYLSNRSQVVRKGNEYSTPVRYLLGVPQGSKLGPLLFILYTSDVINAVSHCRLLLYTDDSCLYSSGPSFQSVTAQLQSDIDNLSNWFNKNLLQLNGLKTELVLFKKFCDK